MKFDFDEDVNIDLTPLIDVIFMLLIFFILTTTFSKPVLEVLLPSSKMAEAGEKGTKEILITVTNNGKIYYGESIIDSHKLTEILQSNPDKVLNLCIDKSAPFESFVHILDVAKKERGGKFIISTDVKERL